MIIDKSLGSLKNVLIDVAKQGVTEARARIFGHVLNPTGKPSAHKLLRKKLIGHKLISWYPEDTMRDNPKFVARMEEKYDTTFRKFIIVRCFSVINYVVCVRACVQVWIVISY